MASRGWEVTASHSRQVSRGRRRTSALLSRRLKAQPRAPTCSLARRRNRYQTSTHRFPTSGPQIRLDLLCCGPKAGGKHQRYIQIQQKNKTKQKSLSLRVWRRLLTALLRCRQVLEKRASGNPRRPSFFAFFFIVYFFFSIELNKYVPADRRHTLNITKI